MRVYVTDEGLVRTLEMRDADGRDASARIVREHDDDGKYHTARADADFEMSAADFYLWEDRLFREQRIIRKAVELGLLEEVRDAAGEHGRDIESSQDERERMLEL